MLVLSLHDLARAEEGRQADEVFPPNQRRSRGNPRARRCHCSAAAAWPANRPEEAGIGEETAEWLTFVGPQRAPFK